MHAWEVEVEESRVQSHLQLHRESEASLGCIRTCPKGRKEKESLTDMRLTYALQHGPILSRAERQGETKRNAGIRVFVLLNFKKKSDDYLRLPKW